MRCGARGRRQKSASRRLRERGCVLEVASELGFGVSEIVADLVRRAKGAKKISRYHFGGAPVGEYADDDGALQLAAIRQLTELMGISTLPVEVKNNDGPLAVLSDSDFMRLFEELDANAGAANPAQAAPDDDARREAAQTVESPRADA